MLFKFFNLNNFSFFNFINFSINLSLSLILIILLVISTLLATNILFIINIYNNIVVFSIDINNTAILLNF